MSSLLNAPLSHVQAVNLEKAGELAIGALASACKALTLWSSLRLNSKMSDSTIVSVNHQVEDMIKVLSTRVV